jgi:hypothetical protein
MKTSDLQQMQQQYQLIAENNGVKSDAPSPIQQTADKFMELHRDVHNTIDELQQFMESDEFKFAVNSDWMGVDEDETGVIPSDFDDYIGIFFDYLQ